jgi:hypothetical protein
MLSTVKFCFITIDPRREKHSMSAQRTTAAAAIIKCLCRKVFASRSFPGSLTRYRSQLMMPFSPETPKSSSSYPSPKTPSETHMMFRPCCHGKTKKTGRLQRRDHAPAAHPDPISLSLAAASNNPATTFLERAVLSSTSLFPCSQRSRKPKVPGVSQPK